MVDTCLHLPPCISSKSSVPISHLDAVVAVYVPAKCPYHTKVPVAMFRYLFSTEGIGACNYNMKVVGVYSIVFSVTNSQGLSANVTRTLVVQPTCFAGQFLCPDKASTFNPSAPFRATYALPQKHFHHAAAQPELLHALYCHIQHVVCSVTCGAKLTTHFPCRSHAAAVRHV